MEINKPNNYEQTQAMGDFQPVEIGPHKLVIKQVSGMVSKTQKPMIVVYFDFAKDDKQPEYFANQYRDDIRPNKKWPNQGTAYILTEDQDGRCSRNFKTFCTCVEKSNTGFSVAWGERFCECFKNKVVGGNFGIVEEMYKGEAKKKRTLRWFISADKISSTEPPADKLLTEEQKQQASVGWKPDANGFINIPDGVDDEGLPFN